MSTVGTQTIVAFDVEAEVAPDKWNPTHCGAPTVERARQMGEGRRRIVEVTNVRTVRVVEYIEPDETEEGRPWMVSEDTGAAIDRALARGYVDPVDYDD